MVSDVIRRPSMFDLIFLHSVYMDAFYKSFGAALSVFPSVSNGSWSGCQVMKISLQQKRYVGTMLFLCFLIFSFTKRPLCGATVITQNFYRAYVDIIVMIKMIRGLFILEEYSVRKVRAKNSRFRQLIHS